MKEKIELQRLIEYNDNSILSYDDLPELCEGDTRWIASLSSMTYYNGNRRLPITAAPSQPIESGRFWYLYGNTDTVYGGYNDNDKDLYEITIDLETGEVYYNL
jgi:hypothetical protein